MHFNSGDLLFQLFSFGILFLAGAVFVRFFQSNARSKKQLDRIEEKLDQLHQDQKSKF
ncbi:DUF4083 domain-containing protein [Bacillus sp. FJAT-42376]|uniref:DUF4083 domain-containing protein n=1 Tax=Bacillus sp. FJAT-42376 TaxID=2014076 RepID=UPI000F514812|nr:DUF4083 domain-containing protein [Bacillus sp. FJAT-42376]